MFKKKTPVIVIFACLSHDMFETCECKGPRFVANEQLTTEIYQKIYRTLTGGHRRVSLQCFHPALDSPVMLNAIGVK